MNPLIFITSLDLNLIQKTKLSAVLLGIYPVVDFYFFPEKNSFQDFEKRLNQARLSFKEIESKNGNKRFIIAINEETLKEGVSNFREKNDIGISFDFFNKTLHQKLKEECPYFFTELLASIVLWDVAA